MIHHHGRKVSEKSHFPFLTLRPLHSAGVSLNPIIVYCANQEEMDLWFGLLQENIEANGGTALQQESYTRVKVSWWNFSIPTLLQIPSDTHQAA